MLSNNRKDCRHKMVAFRMRDGPLNKTGSALE